MVSIGVFISLRVFNQIKKASYLVVKTGKENYPSRENYENFVWK